MDKKQYEVMSLIMAKGRKFLDDVFHMMQDHGLTDKAYELSLSIDGMGEIREDMQCDYLLSVELGKDSRTISTEEWRQTKFIHWNKDGKGWLILHDPLGETGSIPEDKDLSDLPFTDIGGEEEVEPEDGETATDAGRSGNGSLWFRDDDGDIPMVCWGDLNGMAESDPGV